MSNDLNTPEMTDQKKPSGMIVHVYRNKCFGDTSNNGISNRFDKVTLCGPGIPGVFEATDERPAVWYDPRGYDRETGDMGPPGYMTPVIRPSPSKEHPWGMFGGNFAYSSDSRFRDLTRDGGPIPFHDRFE